MTLKERCCRYALTVQCRYCSTQVYLPELVEEEIDALFASVSDINSIEDFKSHVERTCEGCSHMMSRILDDE